MALATHFFNTPLADLQPRPSGIGWLWAQRRAGTVGRHQRCWGGRMPPDRWFGVGSCEGAREGAGARAVDDALIHDDPKLPIVFCSQMLGEGGIRSEIDRLAAMASGAPVAGFYTYGEIARTRGVRGFHNQTLVVLSIG